MCGCRSVNVSPVTMTSSLRLKAERDSILSACTGATGDVTLTDSAVIMLYVSMLGAGDMFAMITMALSPLMNSLLMIPFACLASRLGNRRLIIYSCLVSVVMYLMISLAPFFGVASVPVLFLALTVFSAMHTAHVSGWFPLLDSILTCERRSAFLGRMRFLWQFSSAVFLFVVGVLIGKNPPLSHLQLVLLTAAFIYSGRPYFISKIPTIQSCRRESVGLRQGLLLALRNKPLVTYSVYLFVLNLCSFGTIPLTTIYLKKHLLAPDNITVLISAASLVGMLVGSLCAGWLLNRFGIRRMILVIHVAFTLINGLLFLIGKDSLSAGWSYAVIALLLFVYSFIFANANIASTSEMMALSQPGNKTMGMAFCGTFNALGAGLSRLLCSLVLGAGVLSPCWHVGAREFCHYQTIYLIYSVSLLFAALCLVIVPAVFPQGEYRYREH